MRCQVTSINLFKKNYFSTWRKQFRVFNWAWGRCPSQSTWLPKWKHFRSNSIEPFLLFTFHCRKPDSSYTVTECADLLERCPWAAPRCRGDVCWALWSPGQRSFSEAALQSGTKLFQIILSILNDGDLKCNVLFSNIRIITQSLRSR